MAYVVAFTVHGLRTERARALSSYPTRFSVLRIAQTLPRLS